MEGAPNVLKTLFEDHFEDHRGPQTRGAPEPVWLRLRLILNPKSRVVCNINHNDFQFTHLIPRGDRVHVGSTHLDKGRSFFQHL